MKQYIITDAAGINRADIIAAIADGRNAFTVFFTPGVARHYTAAGLPNGAEEIAPDRDAVAVSFAGTPEDRADAVKQARKRAAGRETVRAFEDRADAILQKAPEDRTAADRAALLSCIKIAFHDSGKIESNYSIDSWAGCEFCEKMRAAAADSPLIICGGCYAAKDSYKEFSWRRHALNARILSGQLFTVSELKTLALPAENADVRIDEDGDIVNETHARNILRTFDAFPRDAFGFWQKNTPAVTAALYAEGVHTRAEKLARYPHVRFIQSSILIGFAAKPVWFADATFTVYPDHKTTNAAIAAGAWPCNGRKCIDCKKHCYRPENNDAEHIENIAEYLRAGKDARAAILAAYTERIAAGAML